MNAFSSNVTSGPFGTEAVGAPLEEFGRSKEAPPVTRTRPISASATRSPTARYVKKNVRVG
jgi:hypothetical protein